MIITSRKRSSWVITWHWSTSTFKKTALGYLRLYGSNTGAIDLQGPHLKVIRKQNRVKNKKKRENLSLCTSQIQGGPPPPPPGHTWGIWLTWVPHSGEFGLECRPKGRAFDEWQPSWKIPRNHLIQDHYYRFVFPVFLLIFPRILN